jgi:hypothetical protein
VCWSWAIHLSRCGDSARSTSASAAQEGRDVAGRKRLRTAKKLETWRARSTSFQPPNHQTPTFSNAPLQTIHLHPIYTSPPPLHQYILALTSPQSGLGPLGQPDPLVFIVIRARLNLAARAGLLFWKCLYR